MIRPLRFFAAMTILAASLTLAAAAQGPEDEVTRLRSENQVLKNLLQQQGKQIQALTEKFKVFDKDKAVQTLNEQIRALQDELLAVKNQLAQATAASGTGAPGKSDLPAAQGATPTEKASPEPPNPGKWEGLRGLKWGTKIAQTAGMVLVEDAGDSKFYRLEGEKLTIGDATIESINYSFYKGRFDSVTVAVKGFANWDPFRRAVFATYGPGLPSSRSGDTWFWGSGLALGRGVADVGMALSYNKFSGEGSLFMFYRPLQAEQEADAREKAKKAAKDF